MTGISIQSKSKIRKAITEKIKEKKDYIFEKIGGNGVIVQIDETAICRGRVIENPSSTLDTDSDIQWLIGWCREY